MTPSAPRVRPPAVAGSFYPGDAKQLADTIKTYMGPADFSSTSAPPPKALIVPHAGYIYSGAAAARALKRFQPDRDQITRIVLMGPCHRVAVRGLAAPEVDAFATPLGVVQVDQEAIGQVADLPFVVRQDAPHTDEHSLEVQLPIIQSILDQFTLVPFAVGTATNEEVATVLERLWGGPETRIVISSDLSHFLTQEQANQLDEQTAQAIEHLDWNALSYDQACGRVPIAGLLTVAKNRDLSVDRLALLTSADTAGSSDRVVGYGAWAFH